MTTYIALMHYTDKGMGQIRRSPERLDDGKKLLEEMGGSFKQFFMTIGGYDIVLIYDAPDDAVSARFTLLLGAQGYVRTTTLKAFPEEAYRELIRSLG
ncbi:MAG: GYD domain-containing protein [Geminicoccaceae bacterium]|nr:GYD domain-containing protein [Geminicoccaceae bacterium]